MPQLINYGNGSPDPETASADIPVTNGSTVVVGLNNASGVVDGEINSSVFVKVQLKTPDNKYVTIDSLSVNRRALALSGPATYRLVRINNGSSVGAFSA